MLATFWTDERRDIALSVVPVLLALVLITALVTRTSQAALSGDTTNAGNSVNTDSLTLTLTDSDNDTAMFSVTDMNPGDSEARCLRVTYADATDSLPVVIYTDGTPGVTDAGDIDEYFNITIEEGTKTPAPTSGNFDCTGFVADLVGQPIESGTLESYLAAHTSYANGAGVWDPTGAGGETKDYRITIELDAATPSSAGDQTISALEFTWEVQTA